MPAAVAAPWQSCPDHPLVGMETAAPGPSHAMPLPETPSDTCSSSATVILVFTGYSVNDSGSATTWRREPARVEPAGNARAYWIVARAVSSSTRSMKVASNSAASGTASSARNVSGSVTNLRISSSEGAVSGSWLVVWARIWIKPAFSDGYVASVTTTAVISGISRRFSSFALKGAVHESRQVYRGSGSSVSLNSLPHLAQASSLSTGKAGAGCDCHEALLLGRRERCPVSPL